MCAKTSAPRTSCRLRLHSCRWLSAAAHQAAWVRTIPPTPLPGFAPTQIPTHCRRPAPLDPGFVPCLNVFQGFPGRRHNASSELWDCQRVAACPGPLQTLGIFALAVPAPLRGTQHPAVESDRFSVPSAGSGFSKSGYVRHQRYPSTRNARCASVPKRYAEPIPWCVGGASITTNTVRATPSRAPRAQGINGYNGFQLFANDAYSHYLIAADHWVVTALGSRLFPGRLHLLAVDGRNLVRQHRLQYRVQRRIHAGRFARALRFRPHPPPRCQLPLRPALGSPVPPPRI